MNTKTARETILLPAWRLFLLASSLALFAPRAQSDAGFANIQNVGEWQSSSATDPAVATAQAENGWLALALPVQEGTRSPCCWDDHWDRPEEFTCRLGKRGQSHGTTTTARQTSSVSLFAQVKRGSIRAMVLAGPDCPVDAGGVRITTLDSASSRGTLAWLDSLARGGDEDVQHPAVQAIALSEGDAATQRLLALARAPSEWPARDAIFWLGEVRGEAGYRALDGLLGELPNGEIRRSINFALAQNSSEAAAERLVRVTKEDHDPQQREDAVFWLAQSHPEKAQPLLVEMLKDATGPGDKILFAVSQLGDGSGDALLFEIAADSGRSDEIRRQAFFWLAQSENEQTIERLTRLLTKE